MSSGPLGPCWASGSWSATSWESNSWCPAVPVPVPVVSGTVHHGPLRRVRVLEQHTGASLAVVSVAAIGLGEPVRSGASIGLGTVTDAFAVGRKGAQAGTLASGAVSASAATRADHPQPVPVPVALRMDSRRARYLAALARQPIVDRPSAVWSRDFVCDEDDELALLEVA